MPSVDKSMKRGIKVVQAVRESIPNSLNYDSTSSFIRKEDGDLLHLGDPKQLGDIRDKIFPLIRSADHGNYFTSKGKNLTTVTNITNIVMENDTGNCLELSFVTAYKMHEDGASGVDIVTIGPKSPSDQTDVDASVLPHWFVVVGRSHGGTDRRSHIGMPDTWGDNAVIVDAWDKTVYPAKMYYDFWAGVRKAAGKVKLECMLMFRI